MLSLFHDISGPVRPNGRRALLTEDEFRTLVLHECARCDRNAHQFSLIQVLLDNPGGEGDSAGLVKRVLKRIRATDEAGWLGKENLGIFLPETDREGADIFARAVCDGFAYQIYTYPEYTLSGEDDDQRSYRDPGPSKKEESGAARDILRRVAWEEAPGPGNPFPLKIAVTQEVEFLVNRRGMPLWKRIMDILGSLVFLLLLSPLFLLMALYIKSVSRGPVFYRQERVGYLGRPFTIWKFRTMKANSDCNVHRDHLKDLIGGDKVLTKLDDQNDCRWIPLAGILRKSCIDELPQLFNVLKGDMSLVGPRPVLFYEAEEYSLWQRQRFHSVPGMTGLWQVSGKNRLTFSQMMRLDARYSRRYNVLMDLFIFIKTIPAIMGQMLGSVRRKLSAHPLKENITLWGRSLSNLLRQVF